MFLWYTPLWRCRCASAGRSTCIFLPSCRSDLSVYLIAFKTPHGDVFLCYTRSAPPQTSWSTHILASLIGTSSARNEPLQPIPTSSECREDFGGYINIRISNYLTCTSLTKIVGPPPIYGLATPFIVHPRSSVHWDPNIVIWYRIFPTKFLAKAAERCLMSPIAPVPDHGRPWHRVSKGFPTHPLDSSILLSRHRKIIRTLSTTTPRFSNSSVLIQSLFPICLFRPIQHKLLSIRCFSFEETLVGSHIYLTSPCPTVISLHIEAVGSLIGFTLAETLSLI